jgi:hypothetical protein
MNIDLIEAQFNGFSVDLLEAYNGDVLLILCLGFVFQTHTKNSLAMSLWEGIRISATLFKFVWLLVDYGHAETKMEYISNSLSSASY